MENETTMSLLIRLEKLEKHVQELYLCLQAEPNLRLNYEKIRNVIEKNVELNGIGGKNEHV